MEEKVAKAIAERLAREVEMRAYEFLLDPNAAVRTLEINCPPDGIGVVITNGTKVKNFTRMMAANGHKPSYATQEVADFTPRDDDENPACLN